MVASEGSKEVVWLRKFLSGLEVITGIDRLIKLYCDNTTVMQIPRIQDTTGRVSTLIESII